MAVHNQQNQPYSNQQKGKSQLTYPTRSDDSEERYCDRCRRHGHTRSECFYLVGGPPGWKPRSDNRKKRVNVAATTSTPNAEGSSESDPFSPQQANALEKLLTRVLGRTQGQKSQAENQISALFASQGNTSIACSVKSENQNLVEWIIDSGCSDHMTGLKSVLEEYQTYPKIAGVRIADGSLAKVEGIGRVRINQRKVQGGRLELLSFEMISSSWLEVVVQENQGDKGLVLLLVVVIGLKNK
ncbi:hypothetical protein LINGRAPRIM_LOCUS2009 [Linum grandiflorum]